MSDALNTVDAFLQGAATRLLPPATAAIILDASSNTFAVSGPSSISFVARFIDMDGTVTFSASGGTLTSISGNTCVLLASNMPGTTATVTATMTYRGTVFSATRAISKVADGATGGTGSNGTNVASVFIYQRNGTGTAPTLPSATTTYTFSTGGLTGLNNGWTTSVPAIGSGAYLFISVATASSTSSTDTIASGEWSAAQIMAQNGADGGVGTRGAGTFYATGSSWSDATADAATPGSNVTDDVVTISNGSTFVLSKRWSGSAWVSITTVIDGTLVVTGTIGTNALQAASVTATKISVIQLDAISATIGTLRTATSGARTEVADNVIRVYDSSNVLRVKIGNLA